VTASASSSRGVDAGHKVALREIDAGEPVRKYGFPIGEATAPIAAGGWVHSHNLQDALRGRWTTATSRGQGTGDRGRPAPSPPSWRLPARDGARGDAQRGVDRQHRRLRELGGGAHRAAAIERFAGAVDGVFSFAHPYGCSQLGDDLGNTQKVLAGLLRHPNAGGVLVLGLGCENNQLDALLALPARWTRSRIRFFNTQDVVDEVEEGIDAVGELVARWRDDRRVEVPASELCSATSAAAPTASAASPPTRSSAAWPTGWRRMGGGVILTEVPEMFGAEQRADEPRGRRGRVRRVVEMVNDFKEYFLRHGQPVYENPSPGNKAGGLTTLEEKSLGAIQKGGRATVTRVLRYGQR
jgi:altronate hydrolase